MEEVKLYKWQQEAIDAYDGKGIIKAVTAAGKSLVGRKIAEKIGGNIIVSAHRIPILSQWIKTMDGIPNVQFLTFNVLCKNKFNNIDLLIVDEVHRSTSPEFVKLYDNVQYKNVIGLSATPNKKSIDKCGPIITDVGFDKAKVSPFFVVFKGIDLNPYETNKYRQLSFKIAKMASIENPSKEEKRMLNNIIMKRRDVVYRAQSRIPFAINLIMRHWAEGNKILVMCQRIEQVEEISKRLHVIPHIQYHSKKKEDLNKYKSGEVNLCLSVGMLREGFDDPSTDVGIVVSTSITESYNIQSIGRIIRYKEGKDAKIYILVANKTTDTRIIDIAKDKAYEYDTDRVIMPEKLEFQEEYYRGKRYGFSMGKVWKQTKDGRQFMMHHNIIKKLQKIKPAGGSFRVSKDGVYTKVDNRIIKVSDEEIKFVPVKDKIELDVEDLFDL